MTKLPDFSISGETSVEKALKLRRSVRHFTNQPLTREQISQLLWAAQGINRPNQGRRTCPSAGATYPLNTYAVTSEGIFRYHPKDHKLEEVKKGDYREQLSRAALSQQWVAKAPLDIVFTAVYERTTGRYGNRGIRYVHMEAGHAAQNVHLQAVALNLGSVPIGAFEDDKVSEVIECDAQEVPLYIIPVGYPAE